MKQITVALLGAGDRGMDAYGPYALRNPGDMKFVAVAEPNKERKEEFKRQHRLTDEQCYDTWEDLLKQPRLADALFICTSDKMHFEPAIQALEKGYHILLEKPMSTDPYECIVMGDYAEKFQRVFSVCHVLRYTPFFSTIKKVIENGDIGDVVSIQHNENVSYWHQSHSFVRGHFNNSDETSPMILQKCCHDMDIMLWLVGKDCLRLSSFGSLTHFKSENAPKGAPERCLDGCPVSAECPYYAPKFYLTEDVGWPTSAISINTDYASRKKALEVGQYGRCVYHCNNNVVDHQVVSLEFEDGVTAAFTMCAFTNGNTRSIKIMGTKGEIRGYFEKNEIEIINFGKADKKVINFKESKFGHGGGDDEIVREFVDLVRSEGQKKGRASAEVSVQGSLMAFAAEESRITKKVVTLSEFKKQKSVK